MFQYRKATEKDLRRLWSRSILGHPFDRRYRAWKRVFLQLNRNGTGATFAVLHNGKPVGEGTLLFSPQADAVRGREWLADGVQTANINALRIRKPYEGQGQISALIKEMERYAAARGVCAPDHRHGSAENAQPRHLPALGLHGIFGRSGRRRGNRLVLCENAASMNFGMNPVWTLSSIRKTESLRTTRSGRLPRLPSTRSIFVAIPCKKQNSDFYHRRRFLICRAVLGQAWKPATTRNHLRFIVNAGRFLPMLCSDGQSRGLFTRYEYTMQMGFIK